jgi:hypothetical protein
MSRRAIVAIVVAVIVVGGIGGVAAGGLLTSSPSAPPPSGSSGPIAGASAPASGQPSGDAGGGSPSASPSATPSPTPVPILGPLDGLPITAAQAKLHPIAVMIDDLSPARPQSGFSDASVVWQAPAEGGIPRYMMVFQEGLPKDVGPVRSSRYYFIAWAAEWRAVYVHAGGSPQALSTLRSKGAGQLVFNVDQFRWGRYFRRVTYRFAPHNLYTTGNQLRQLVAQVKATKAPGPAVWKFAPDAPLVARPSGGRIEVDYQANRIIYKYDRKSNTYFRFVSGGTRQVDAGTKKAVAPKNVVIMRMQFGPLTSDPETFKHRLEAKVIGSGTAWVATNGKTVKGTWRKKSLTAPTLFYDSAGHQLTLTTGQTFVQVMKTTDTVSIKDGKVPPPPPSPNPSAPAPSPSALGASREMPA